MVPGNSAHVPANPLPDGEATTFFIAGCLSNQFDLRGKPYAREHLFVLPGGKAAK
jgi:hypothetical protein